MAKSSNQKLKLMYLLQILMEKTDETHALTMPEILSALEAYGIRAERKSIYDDVDCLRQYGVDVIGYQENRTFYYKIVSRKFELAELKLLVDTVQSARFITVRKSNELIKKIESLASRYEASKLQRQVFVGQRIKTMNESIYSNVDRLHEAIAGNNKISFSYFKWTADKTMVAGNDGRPYTVSPWALSWDDENYYLVAYDSEEDKIKHFRVDKMKRILILDAKRDGSKKFRNFDMAVYAKRVFGMYGGREENVTLECVNELAGVIIDRFGKDVIMVKTDESHFRVSINVMMSRQFLGWVMALGDGARIVGPDSVIAEMNAEIDRLIKQYRS